QAEHASNADGFDEGDIKTAQQFGENFALTLNAYQINLSLADDRQQAQIHQNLDHEIH
ncbi:hypothetical protein RFX58_15090, partial [Acinetobacter baumannii]|nr:hypothetical protein [Acinetobacter baumannii]